MRWSFARTGRFRMSSPPREKTGRLDRLTSASIQPSKRNTRAPPERRCRIARGFDPQLCKEAGRMSKGRRKTGEPSPEDRRRVELLEKFRGMIPEMKRPSANRVKVAPEPEWSYKTRSFLLGVSDDYRPWEQLAWLAATDVCGCGVPAEEVLDLFVTAVRAGRPGETRQGPGRRRERVFQAPAAASRLSRRWGTGLVGAGLADVRHVRAGGSGPGTAAVQGPGKPHPQWIRTYDFTV